MANQIVIFNNPQFGEIRTAGTSDNPLFCLADVCKALGLTQGHVRERLSDGVVSTEPITDVLGRIQQANFVNEDGLYDVILDSRKPEAKMFRKWVTSEVLPSIRKTGEYSVKGRLPDFSNPAEAARAWADQYEKALLETNRAIEAERQVIELSDTIAAMKPKADYCDMVLASKETVTITQVAQDFGMSAKSFNTLLKDLRIQHKVAGQWILYAQYLPLGYVHSEPIIITHKSGRKETRLFSKWSQKGRLFLYEKLKACGILPLIERAA